jgi:hypothetical protein
MRSKFRILFALMLSLLAKETYAQEFTCKTLDGEYLTINEWPIFIITSRSQEDLKDALQCASLVSSLETSPWLLDFAWPGNEYAKRNAASAFLKSAFMKSHSTILENAPADAPLISLVDSNFEIIWCSLAYPNEEDWDQAMRILNRARKP